MDEHPRRFIYYWKCDRPAAYHGTAERDARPDIEQMMRTELAARFPAQPLTLFPAGGQGNHITFRATIGDESAFVRIDDGDDQDDYIQVESHLLGEVRALGVSTPRVLAVDASRVRVPFAWQVLEDIPHPDLNTHFKSGALDVATIAHGIGAAGARWQAIQPSGFGPFAGEGLRSTGHLTGYHEHYADYFHLHLDRHLRFLTGRGFLTAEESAEIGAEIARHHSLRGSQTQGIVRVGAPHPDLIARVLDWGAHGIMVPHVNSPAEAEQIVQAAYYAPRGRRGFSRTVRAHDYGRRSPEQSPAPVIMAQIESIEGVNHAAEIAQTEGVEVLFVGPADLQHELSHRGPIGTQHEAPPARPKHKVQTTTLPPPACRPPRPRGRKTKTVLSTRHEGARLETGFI